MRIVSGMMIAAGGLFGGHSGFGPGADPLPAPAYYLRWRDTSLMVGGRPTHRLQLGIDNRGTQGTGSLTLTVRAAYGGQAVCEVTASVKAPKPGLTWTPAAFQVYLTPAGTQIGQYSVTGNATESGAAGDVKEHLATTIAGPLPPVGHVACLKVAVPSIRLPTRRP